MKSGHLVFVRGGALWAVPFDQEHLDIMGTPVPVVEGVRVDDSVVQYAVADDGTLVYFPANVAVSESTLVLVDRQGSVNELSLPSDNYVGGRRRTPRLRSSLRRG